MLHQMAEWALDTFYVDQFNCRALADKAFPLTGPNAIESVLIDLMERIVVAYPALRLLSRPSIGEDGRCRHLELGVEGEEPLVDQALEDIWQESSGAASAGSGAPEGRPVTLPGGNT